MVQKSKLIEKIAELLAEKKLPLVADIAMNPLRISASSSSRARTVDPEMMMEQLFKLTELESRFPMNMNLLADGVVPRVVSLKEALRQWLDHRREVLLRRARHRQAEIVHRLEVLAGMIIVFLNLDRVIQIIREAEDPKQELKTSFDLSEVQANYILDTRLRGLRRLEEMQLRRENDELAKEKREIEGLLGDEAKQWKAIAAQIRELKKKYGPDTKIGRRRTSFGSRPISPMLISRER